MKIKENSFINDIVFIIVLVVILCSLYGCIDYKAIQIQYLISFIGTIIGFYLFYQRNKLFETQLIQKDIQYIKESEFKNFLEATKLLTNKDSTIEAKISAIYLLYDVAQNHSQNIDRIIQVLNKQLTPLIQCLENSCDKKIYTIKIKSKKINKYPTENKIIYEYTKKDIIDIDYNEDDFARTIKEWQYKGNDTEKLISTTLFIIRRIILNILQKENKEINPKHIELSNSVIFDIDVKYSGNLRFISKDKPTENLIFLNCSFFYKKEQEEYIANFSYTIYYFVKFINCDLSNCDFSNANLWGCEFINCNLKNTNFNKTECEAVSFINCKNLTINQIQNMKFESKEKIKDDNRFSNKKFYPIFIDSKSQINFDNEIKYFIDDNEYREFIKEKNKTLELK